MADNEAVADDSLELKKRARRRLVGAIALALLAIVVLPMVMDSEPRPASQDVQIRIPSQDGEQSGVRSAEKAAVSAPQAKIDNPPLLERKLPEPAMSAEQKPAATAQPKSEPTLPDPPKTDTGKPAVSARTDVTAAQSSKGTGDKARAAEVAAAKAADESRAAAVLEGKDGSGPWIVQLGAYQNPGNVKQLIGKIKEMGIPVYSEKLDSPQGVRTRVRAGPFPSREAAERAQGRIRKIGVDGPVALKQ